MKVAAPQTFPKECRLRKRSEFRRVYDEGQRRNAPLCAVFYRPNGLKMTRLGVTVPARIGKAVVRNRVKRRLREAFRLHRATIPGGWDIVVNPRSEAATVPFERLVQQVTRLFPHQPPPDSREEAQRR